MTLEPMFGEIVSVTAKLLGSELMVDAALGATELIVETTDDWDDPENGEVWVRLVSDEDVDADEIDETLLVTRMEERDTDATIYVDTPLEEAWVAETLALVDPEVREVTAEVMLDGVDDEEPMIAYVSTNLQDVLEEGVRDHGEGERCQLQWDGEDLYVIDVFGVELERSGNYIDPETMPPAVIPPGLGDGAPPSDPETAPLILRSIQTNIIDMRAYEIPDDHLAFLPEFSTDAGSNWIALGQTGHLYPHTGLDYNLTYVYRFRTEDIEGLQSGYSPETSGTIPRKVGEGGANDIDANSVTAEMLSSLIALIGMIASGTEGQRWEADANGIRLYDENSQIIASLPTDDGSRPFFRATLEALGLDVTGLATLRGATSVAEGGVLTFQGSVGDPVTAPTLSIGLEEVFYAPGFSQVGASVGAVAWDASAGTIWCAMTDSTLIELNATTGAVIRQSGDILDLTSPDRDIKGLVATPTQIYVLLEDPSSGNRKIRRIRKSDFGSTWDEVIASDTTDPDYLGNTAEIGMAWDGGNLLWVVAFESVAGSANDNYEVIWYDIGAGADQVPAWNGDTVRDIAATVDQVGLRGIEIAPKANGTDEILYILTDDGTGTVRAWDVSGHPTNMPQAFDENYSCEDGLAWIFHDGTRMLQAREVFEGIQTGYGLQVRKHTNWSWAAADSSKYWVGYTWYNDVAPAGVGAEDFESEVSPRSSITMKKRQRLFATIPSFPSGVTSARIYVDRGSSEPALDLQTIGGTTIQTMSQIKLESFASGGAAPPAANDFPAANPARLRLVQVEGPPANPVPGEVYFDTRLQAPFCWDGVSGLWRAISPLLLVHLTDAADENIPNNSWSGLNWGTDLFDPLALHAASAAHIQCPYEGWYRAEASAYIRSGAGSPHYAAKIERAATTAAANTGIVVTRESTTSGTAKAFSISGTFETTADAWYTWLSLFQNSGAGLTTDFTMCFFSLYLLALKP